MIVTDAQQLSTISLQLPLAEQEDVFLALEEEIKRHDAAGLSAPQIGIFRQAFVYYTQPEDRRIPRALIRVANPVVFKMYGGMIDSVEGCLSMPGAQCLVRRYAEIDVQDDISGRMVLTGQDAIVWQHESDHLVGLLMTDVGVLIPKDIRRNDRCYCGSGKKYKLCHWGR